MEGMKPTQGKLEEYLHNSANSILRDAKVAIWEELPNLGIERFLTRHIDKITALMPKVSENYGDMRFRILNVRDRRYTEVIFYIRVTGGLAPFSTFGTHFRLRGELGTEKPDYIYIYYREPYSTTTTRLIEVFREDLELIHNYLEFGYSILDGIATEARVQLIQECNLMKAVMGELPVIAEELAALGFKPRMG
ncbi:MAG: hypothetical protein JJU11_00540 [Candidatus Sumerlaeia bacterium]|nr:hypothetical protein [Candidatus Sumerlaeia bacterium]